MSGQLLPHFGSDVLSHEAVGGLDGGEFFGLGKKGLLTAQIRFQGKNEFGLISQKSYHFSRWKMDDDCSGEWALSEK